MAEDSNERTDASDEPQSEDTDAQAEAAAEQKPSTSRARARKTNRQKDRAEAADGQDAGSASSPDQETSEQADLSKEAAVLRAEEMLSQMGERFGRWATLAGQGARRATARAREGVEDIWAEAKDVRQRNRS